MSSWFERWFRRLRTRGGILVVLIVLILAVVVTYVGYISLVHPTTTSSTTQSTSFTSSTTSSPSTTSTTTTGSTINSSAVTPNLAADYQWFVNNYNSTAKLIQGGYVGSCGYQPNAFDLIDGNLLSGYAILPYNKTLGQTILNTTYGYLDQIGYQNNDRRETLFHHQIPLPILSGANVTIAGTAPVCSNGNKGGTLPFWITSEIPSTPVKNISSNGWNYLTPEILDLYMMGNITGAQHYFNIGVSAWVDNSTYGSGQCCVAAFIFKGQLSNGNSNSRDLAYFLIAENVTHFPVNPSIVLGAEKEIIALQMPAFKGGFATGYRFDGTPVNQNGGHSSNEINALVLIAYNTAYWW
jgi:hypothetical protein